MHINYYIPNKRKSRIHRPHSDWPRKSPSSPLVPPLYHLQALISSTFPQWPLSNLLVFFSTSSFPPRDWRWLLRSQLDLLLSPSSLSVLLTRRWPSSGICRYRLRWSFRDSSICSADPLDPPRPQVCESLTLKGLFYLLAVVHVFVWISVCDCLNILFVSEMLRNYEDGWGNWWKILR